MLASLASFLGDLVETGSVCHYYYHPCCHYVLLSIIASVNNIYTFQEHWHVAAQCWVRPTSTSAARRARSGRAPAYVHICLRGLEHAGTAQLAAPAAGA